MLFDNTKTSTAGWANGLKGRISDLELDNLYLTNELTDTLRPSVRITDFTFIISELLMKNVDFVKKNGLSAGAKDSREKLLDLMEIGETFNHLSCANNELKLRNRSLCAEVQYLKKELAEIKRQENLTL